MSFKTVAAGIAKKQGIPMKNANAELAAGTRRAGAAARKKNPALNKVKGAVKAVKSFAFSGLMGGKSA